MGGTERLLICDGNNLVQRSYYATVGANLHDNRGRPTGALYGSIKAFLGYLKELQPTRCIWMFDDGKSDMRTALRPDYKGHRKYSATSTADPRTDIPQQIDALRDFLDVIDVPSCSQRGVEADDLIARVVKGYGWPENVDDTIILSSDHDMFQLVSKSPLVRICRPGEREVSRRGSMGLGGREAKLKLYGVAEVIEKYGLSPNELPDMWALTGDTGDNIAGIPGIGPKTAAKWMRKHGSLSMVLACESKCEGYEHQCWVNYQMIELDGTVGEVVQNLRQCEIAPCLRDGVLPWHAEPFLARYDLKSLIKEAA